MTHELDNRFRYSSGEPKNGFFIDFVLSDGEKDICLSLVSHGPLGCELQKLIQQNTNIGSLESLVSSGLITKTTLLQMAVNVTQDEQRISNMINWDNAGGLENIQKKGDRIEYKGFKQAETIVSEGEIEKNLVVRYQVIPIYYQYVLLIYDDR